MYMWKLRPHRYVSMFEPQATEVLRLLWFVWSAHNPKVDEPMRSKLDDLRTLFAPVDAIWRSMNSWKCIISVVVLMQTRTGADL